MTVSLTAIEASLVCRGRGPAEIEPREHLVGASLREHATRETRAGGCSGAPWAMARPRMRMLQPTACCAAKIVSGAGLDTATCRWAMHDDGS